MIKIVYLELYSYICQTSLMLIVFIAVLKKLSDQLKKLKKALGKKLTTIEKGIIYSKNCRVSSRSRNLTFSTYSIVLNNHAARLLLFFLEFCPTNTLYLVHNSTKINFTLNNFQDFCPANMVIWTPRLFGTLLCRLY